MKKLSALLFSVIFILTSSYCVFAQSTTEETMAVLTNVETGERYEFPATAVVTAGVQSRSGDTIVQPMHKTVEVTIPTELTNPNSRIPIDKTTSDVSGSCRGMLNIDYLMYTENAGTANEVKYYLLTHIDGGWEELDRQVSSSNRIYAYGCNGYRLGAVQTQMDEVRTTGMSFDVDTGFTKYTNDSANGNVCGAQIRTTLQRVGSSSTWEFEVINEACNVGFDWGILEID